MTDWTRRFLDLAQLVSTWSKDPTTKVGCVIAEDKRIVAIGFNGFPTFINDDARLNDRPLKHQIVIHAECNAIMFAQRNLNGCSIYVHPIIPCPQCASKIIQCGIVSVFAPKTDRKEAAGLDLDLSRRLFEEAGVQLIEV